MDGNLSINKIIIKKRRRFMKKVLIPLFIFLAVLMAIGCSKKSSPTSPAATPTPLPAYVFGAVEQVNGNATVLVQLKIGSSSGNVLTGATVSLNGTAVPETATQGTYITTVTGGYTQGTTLNLNVVSTQGTATASVVMPQGDTITGPANGSTESHLNSFQVTWTGLTSGILEHEILIYVTTPLVTTIDQPIPVQTQNYTVTAGALAVGTYYMSVMADTEAVTFTNASSDSFFGVGNSANTFSVTIN
jgi:hypothetical protein